MLLISSIIAEMTQFVISYQKKGVIMNVLNTYIPHKAFHAVAVRPFQAALPALRQRVKNSELANVRL